MKETRNYIKRAAVMALAVMTMLSMLCALSMSFAAQKVYASEIELVDSWGGDPEEAVAIAENDTKDVTITEEKVVETFVFTPEKDGTYIFSAAGDEDLDTEGQVLDEYGIQIESNDDGPNGSHFAVVFDAVAGKTYYLQASLWGQETGNATFTVTLAESDVTAISFENENGITFTENVGGYMEGEGDDAYYYYDYYDGPSREGSKITVTHKDGSKEVYTYDSDEEGFYSEDGVYLKGLEIKSSQDKTPWTVGGENYIYLTYMSKTASIPVTIMPNATKSIKYQPVKELVLLENMNGYWDEDQDGEFYHYKSSAFVQNGDVLTVTGGDDEEIAYTYNAEEYAYIAADGSRIDVSNVRFSDDQDTNHWVAGGEYTIGVEYMSKTNTIPVKIQANTVKAIEFALANGDIVENTCGGWDTDSNDEEYFNYSIRRILDEGATLTVEDINGNKVAYAYDAENEQYVAENGDTIDATLVEVEFDDDDQYDSHWTAGDTHEINVTYMGRTASVDFNIVAQGANEDQEKADAVEAKIANIPANVTLADEAAVTEAKEAYDALTEDQKGLVSDEAREKLQDAVDKIEDLKEEAEGAEDQKKADAVAALISNLNDNITLADEDAIAAAEAAYNNLTDDQRTLIDKALRTKLDNAIDKINELKDAATGTEDQKKADEVMALIDKLNKDVTLDDAKAVAAAKKAYDALTNEQKALVSKDAKAKLDSAVSKIDTLKANKTFNDKKAKAKAAKVKNLKVKMKAKKKAKITWTAKKGVSGYQIKYSLKKNFKKSTKTINVKGAKKKSATAKKLKAGKKYFVKIRTYTTIKAPNGKTVKVYGKWSKVVTKTAKK